MLKKYLFGILVSCSFVFAKFVDVIPVEPAQKEGCYSISSLEELYGFAAVVNGTLEEGRAAEPSACGQLEKDILVNDTSTIFRDYRWVQNPETQEYEREYFFYIYDENRNKVEIDTNEIERHLWTPIGEFSGAFDGRGHVIRALEYADSLDTAAFIRTTVGSDAEPVKIQNLKLHYWKLGPHIVGGGIVAVNRGNLYFENSVAFGSMYAYAVSGSFVAQNDGNLILKNIAAASGISAGLIAGLVVGVNNGEVSIDSLETSYPEGIVTYMARAEGVDIAGGVVGANADGATLKISNANIATSVSAEKLAGGLVGYNGIGSVASIEAASFDEGDASARVVSSFVGKNKGIVSILNAYSTAPTMKDNDTVGVFVAYNEDSVSLRNVYWIYDGIYARPQATERDAFVGYCSGKESLQNGFYLSDKVLWKNDSSSCMARLNAQNADADAFFDGVVAIALNRSKDGEVWGQDTSMYDNYPKLGRKLNIKPFKIMMKDTLYVGNDTVQYSYGSKKKLPELFRQGYEFLGWYYEGKEDSLVYEITENDYGHKVLYAKWDGLPTLPAKDSLGCYLISSAGELYGFAEFVPQNEKRCAKLTKDIVVNKDVLDSNGDRVNDYFRVWDGLGSYTGVFDGQGHTISGLYIGALFEEVRNGDTLVIKNLGFRDSYFIAYYAGAFVSENDGFLTIDSCFNASTVYNKTYWAGGFVGKSSGNLVISNSHNEGLVEQGSGLVGTMVGRLLIVNSYNSGYLKGIHSMKGTGGLLGQSYGKTTIVNSYNVGHVEGCYNVGGLIGESKRETTILNSYNAGKIEGCYEKYFGLVGEDVSISGSHPAGYSLVMKNVYYPEGYIDENGGIPFTEEQLKNGYLATKLHKYVWRDSVAEIYPNGIDGKIWGQKVGTDPYPVFSGVLEGAVAVPDSEHTTALDTDWRARYGLSLQVVSRNVRVSAAPVGSDYEAYDMQGRILQKGRVESANFDVVFPRAGRYLLRIGNWTGRVDIR